ncbi:class 1 fructose-bisphosphatase [Paracoccus siganidrum]|uniref:Fructose-1,6-bisphosphatase class 1 n=1 Tax=Paracoccus siganidrum TaxID=1276757 RepID=A0A419A7Q2_9RHOB|nr:class 1 fructose-bisphosphatase [Paracoccus siganidrum]RJL16502.1 class 1 fructose-bisphosphatase [Paracoccus siganidrum]RMC38241.1 class 1 fructose-bisphosphatase [Paracoccus siganidrum]
MLKLPNDGPATGRLLSEVLAGDGPAAIIRAIAEAQPPLAARLAAGRLHGDPTEIVGVNDSGDRQKALDVGAHHHMVAVLARAGVRKVLSEEVEAVIDLNPDGAFDVAMDPIDGSGSIGIGAPLGMLFSVLPAAPQGFLRTGRAVVAAGYASFGHSMDFGWSLGDGTHVAGFDAQAGAFRMVRENVTLKPEASTLAYNASNERHWAPGLQAWVREIRAGKDGQRGRDFNMRWLAAAVGELHRILLQGGAFLYPADARPGYERGRLRLIYECAPIAFLIEQAGGGASDGEGAILDRQPAGHHDMSPLIFGAADEVRTILAHIAASDSH